ncbi:uncharacterized protein LOC130703827 isoform X1 [Daphnia carinata]|uniref:uncharacterized protein LOC130703827 isoform X1 n=1 Tax=Daphnia carinata TaxID=120202 RepID=UPI002580722E|nr:uncharacterized protein LOC130703827 isoform X1 [Daphnia carinata]
MDNLSQSLSNSSWENPFGISGNVIPCDLESDEQFVVGEELKAFFDKEEKMYQSSSSVRSDQSHQTEKSNAMASGITIRSFMADSGDSDLINQKLTMSQYIAYKSEPMGPELGESTSSKERPYFSFQEKISLSPHSEKSESGVAEFNPDFSQEPSWMKKKSLSSLSSSENLEIPSKSPDSSENWLIGTNKSASQNSMVDIVEKSEASVRVKESSISGAPILEPVEPAICMSQHQPCETSELPSLYWKPHNESLIDGGYSHLEPSLMRGAISNCHSYVAGHVESLSHEPDGSRRPSEIAASSRSSSPASTIRENTDFPRCESLISEPQLSSTREITDDFNDVSSTEKRVHFQADSLHSQISRTSIEKQNLHLGSILEVSSKPNLCSTAMTPTAKASEHVMRILANLSQNGNSIVNQEQEVKNARSSVLKDGADAETESKNLNLEWERIERELTQHDSNGFSPESWVAVFSNTSCLSTPLLMNKIKEHVLRMNGRGMSSGLLPSESSGIGGSGFEITESRIESASALPSNKTATNSIHPSLAHEKDLSSRASSSNMNPSQHSAAESSQYPPNPVAIPPPAAKIEDKFLKTRHTLSAMPPRDGIKPALLTPVDGLAKNDFNHIDYVRLTSTAIKAIPATNGVRSSSSTSQPKMISANIQQSLQAPLIKCSKSQVYFGGAKIRQTQKQNVVVRNSSFEQALELELRIKDSDDFYMLNEDRSLVSSCNYRLEPRQECCLDLVFQPKNLGPLASKLNLYPRCQSAKKVKYTVDLFGYGGSSIIQQLTPNAGDSERTLVPKTKGAHWNCQLVLKNRGNVAGFAFIQPLQENGKVMEACQCIIMPQSFSLNAGDFKEINIFIHPTEDGKLAPFKLRVVWGDEPLRLRWMRCIANGSPLKPASEIVGFDWTRLLQLESNDKSTNPPVGDEDTTLFFKNVAVDEIKVVIPDRGQDSHFVTLAVEPATVLESSSVNDTMLSERRLTNAVSGKMSSDMAVSAAVTELTFPSTKVGTISSQKIPLQNWSGIKQEVRVKEISGPFIMKHTRNAVPGGYFTRLPIQFHPTKIGFHSGSVLLDVGQHGQTITISLKGDAF